MKKQSLILSSIVLIFFISTSFSNSLDLGNMKFVSGNAHIIDGDTIKINGKKIRLFGIDAPELKQKCGWWDCGKEAKWWLELLVQNKIITCFYKKKDKYRRILGICHFGKPNEIPVQLMTAQFEINGWMVQMGLAIAYKRYSDRYAKLENDAKKNKMGIWKYNEFEKPEEWRKKNK